MVRQKLLRRLGREKNFHLLLPPITNTPLFSSVYPTDINQVKLCIHPPFGAYSYTNINIRYLLISFAFGGAADWMGWSYPDISLEDLMRVIKGFVDMLVLASGYQSSGRLSHWDSHNIEKAFQWATFLEFVISSLSCHLPPSFSFCDT